MGDDFSALLRYRGIDAAISDILARLESGEEPTELTDVVALGTECGFAFGTRHEPAVWRPLSNDWDQALLRRPPLPNLSVQLCLPSGFAITFGSDAVWLWHYLRWSFFREDRRWQNAMVSAVNWFRETLGATDAVVTWDNSHLIRQFQAAKPFEQAVQTAISEGEVEVKHAADLCWTESKPSEELVIADGSGGWAPIYLTHNRGWLRLPWQPDVT